MIERIAIDNTWMWSDATSYGRNDNRARGIGVFGEWEY